MTSTSVGLAEFGEGVIAQAIGIALPRLAKLDDVIGDDCVGAVAPFFRPKGPASHFQGDAQDAHLSRSRTAPRSSIV